MTELFLEFLEYAWKPNLKVSKYVCPYTEVNLLLDSDFYAGHAVLSDIFLLFCWTGYVMSSRAYVF
jgi:hypothetical protein